MSTDIASLKLEVDATQPERAQTSLDKLGEAANKAADSADKLKASSTNVSSAVERQAAVTSTLSTQNQQLTAANERLIESWAKQVVLQGRSENEIRLMTAATQGFTEQQMESVRAINAANDAHERAAEVTARAAERSAMLARGLSAVATAAVGAATAIYGYAVKAASEGEQTSLRLEAVLRATGESAAVSRPKIEALVDELSKLSKFDDDQIREGAATLLKFGAVGADSFERVLRAGVDLAAFNNTDLKTSLQQLGQAMEHPESAMRSLRSAGISLTQAQQDQIRSLVELGKVQEAGQIVLQAYERATKGAAETLNSGYAKATNDAAKATDDLLKAIGNTSIVADTYQHKMERITLVLNSLKDVVTDGGLQAGLTMIASKIAGAVAGPGLEKLLVALTNLQRGGPAGVVLGVDSSDASDAAAMAARSRAAAEQAATATRHWQEEWKKLTDGLRGNDARFAERAADIQRVGQALGLTTGEIERQIAALDKQIYGHEREAAARKEAAERAKAYSEAMRDMNAEASRELQLGELRRSLWTRLTAQMEAGTLELDEYTQRIEYVSSHSAIEIKAQQDVWAAIDTVNRAKREYIKTLQQEQAEYNRISDGIAKNVESLQVQVATFGMTRLEADLYTIALQRAQVQNSDMIPEQKKQTLATLDQAEALVRVRDANLQAEESFKWWRGAVDDISRAAGDFLVDFVEHGSTSFRKLWDDFKNWGLRALAEIGTRQIFVSLTGMAASGGAAAAGLSGLGGLGALGGLGSIASSIGGIFSLGGASFGTSFATSGLGQMLGLSTAASVADGGMLLTGLGSTLAPVISALPWAALAAVAVPMIVKAFDKGDAMRTGTFASNSALGAGNPLFQSSSAFGSFGVFNDQWFSDKDMGPAMQSLLSTIKGLDNAIAQAVGPALTQTITAALQSGKSYEFGMEHTDLNSSGVAGGILKDRYTQVLNAIDSSLGALLTGFEGTGDEMAKFVLGLVSVHQALQDTASITKVFGEALNISDIQGAARDGESLVDTFTRLSTTFASTNAIAEMLGKDAATAFGAVGLASTEARESLIALSGGMDAMNSKAAFYYQNFLTEAERVALVTPKVTQTMQDLGLAGVSTIEQFNKIVNSIDLSTEAGRTLYAALMDIAPAFFMVAHASTEATEQILNAIPRIVNGVRTLEPIQMRGAGQTPWELQGPAPTGHGGLPGRNAGETPGLRVPSTFWTDFGNAVNSALSAINEIMNRDPAADAMLVANADDAYAALMRQGEALRAQAAANDQSVEGMQALTSATNAYYNAQVQLLAQIEQTKRAISSMFGDTIRSLTLQTLDKEGQYNFLRDEAARLNQQMLQETDPAKIRALAERINADINQAFGLLTPEQQKAMLGQFRADIEAVQKAAEQHLTDVGDTVQTTVGDVLKTIRDEIKSVADKLAAAGTANLQASGQNLEASGMLLEAARTPLTIETAPTARTTTPQTNFPSRRP